MEKQEDRIITSDAELKNLTGLSRRTIDDRIKLGTFPKGIPLGWRKDGRVSMFGWHASTLQVWIAARKEENRELAA
jgi:predicted DNA-binding transcriptional regulator AlpA